MSAPSAPGRVPLIASTSATIKGYPMTYDQAQMIIDSLHNFQDLVFALGLYVVFALGAIKGAQP